MSHRRQSSVAGNRKWLDWDYSAPRRNGEAGRLRPETCSEDPRKTCWRNRL